MKSGTFKTVLDWVWTVVIALVLSLTVHTYVAEGRWIPSESMVPTLKVHDRLIVDKVSYKIHDINRGDIVVFTPPPAVHKNDDLIKRVIGLPGETVLMKDGLVYIDGSPLTEEYAVEKNKSNFGPFKVPEDCVFVMGDNRDNSYDSRFWGPLPVKNILGRAAFRYYPLSSFKTF